MVKLRRKSTKNTRGPNASERKFQEFTKHSNCIVCGNSPCIVDHIFGSTKKVYVGLERILIGHFAVLPLCQQCDDIKTKGNRRAFKEQCGNPALLWMQHISNYSGEIPENVIEGIRGEI